MGTIKFRAKMKGDKAEVKAIITHPMETGRRKDKESGETVPAHYIQEIVIEKNGEPMITGDWGASISKNPYIGFTYKGAPGDTLKLTWTDNTGESESAEATIK